MHFTCSDMFELNYKGPQSALVTGLLSIFDSIRWPQGLMWLTANAGIYDDLGPVCVQVCMQRPEVSMGVFLSMIHLCPQMRFFLIGDRYVQPSRYFSRIKAMICS